MKPKIEIDKIALIFGGLTLILFSSKPYILDLIEPSKSIGQVIGENAKDLIESYNGKRNITSPNSKREIWSNVITILSFILFAVSIILSMNSFHNGQKKWFGLVGGVLSVLGIGIYLSHLAIGLMGIIVIVFFVSAIVAFNGI